MKRPEVSRGGGRGKARRLMLKLAAAAAAFTACRNNAPVSTAPPPRPLPALVIDDSLRPTLLAVGRAVLEDALSRRQDTAAVCVVFLWPGRGEFGPELTDLHVLAESAGGVDSRRRFVSMTNCPRTYSSMILTVDAHGNRVDPPPRGYVDPYILTIDIPERWVPKPEERSITVIVRVAQGTGGHEYLCRIRPSVARAAMLPVEGRSQRLTETATCRLDKRYVS